MPYLFRRLLAAILLAGALSSTTANAQEAQAILGTWVAENGAMVIQFYDAGGTFAARYV